MIMAHTDERKLIKTTGILLIGKLAVQFTNYLLLPIYTSVLSLSEYGKMELYNTFSMVLMPLITLQIEQAVFRRLITETEKKRKKIVTTAFYVLIISIAIFTILFYLYTCFFDLEYSKVLYVYYVSMIFPLLFQQVCRGLRQNIKYALGTFVNSLTIMIGSIIFVLCYGWGIVGILAGTIIGNAIGVLFYVCILMKVIDFKYKFFSRQLAVSMLAYSMPLIINQLSSWLINYSDRLIVTQLIGFDENGIYSVANKFFLLPVTFFNIYNLAWTENITAGIKDVNSFQFINRIMEMTIQLYLLVIVFILLILPYIFPILINVKFEMSFYHIPFLLLASFFYGAAAMVGSIYIAFEKTKKISMTTFISGIVNLVIHLCLIKYLGLFAATISTLVSFVWLFVFRYVSVKSFFNLSVQWKNMKFLYLLLLAGIVFYYRGNIISRGITGFVMVLYGTYLLKQYHFKKTIKSAN